MDLKGTPDWISKGNPKKEIEPSVVEEAYAGPDFKIGNFIKLKNKPEWGMGIVVQELKNYNFWVVLPEKENRISSMPWDFNVFNRREMELHDENTTT